jgi:hypothetical protein
VRPGTRALVVWSWRGGRRRVFQGWVWAISLSPSPGWVELTRNSDQLAKRGARSTLHLAAWGGTHCTIVVDANSEEYCLVSDGSRYPSHMMTPRGDIQGVEGTHWLLRTRKGKRVKMKECGSWYDRQSKGLELAIGMLASQGLLWENSTASNRYWAQPRIDNKGHSLSSCQIRLVIRMMSLGI